MTDKSAVSIFTCPGYDEDCGAMALNCPHLSKHNCRAPHYEHTCPLADNAIIRCRMIGEFKGA